MGSQNPLLYSALRLVVGVKLRRQNVSRGDVQSSTDGLGGDIVDTLAATQATPIVYPTSVAVGAPSGTIIAAILAFLQSPEGQALIAALVQMLISMIAGG